jgi:UDP-glucose 4-epimerase
MESEVKAFADAVNLEGCWEIYWAAGVGTMGSPEEKLAIETRILSKLLDFIKAEPRLVSIKGNFAFASTAGAIYAGAGEDVITENTPVAPTTAYAHEKLKQERLISTFAMSHISITALIARISTLYGAGQAKGKQQGLIVEIARRILRNQPIQIFVPFDTIRDYIMANDAAALITNGLRGLKNKSGVFTKIIASEQPATIAEIISIFKRITRRNPRIIISANKLSNLYSRRIQFHSIEGSGGEKIVKTSLLVGIAKVLATERISLAVKG